MFSVSFRVIKYYALHPSNLSEVLNSYEKRSREEITHLHSTFTIFLSGEMSTSNYNTQSTQNFMFDSKVNMINPRRNIHLKGHRFQHDEICIE